MENIFIETTFIRLDALLKFAGLASTGVKQSSMSPTDLSRLTVSPAGSGAAKSIRAIW
jgi:hypothetical protein